MTGSQIVEDTADFVPYDFRVSEVTAHVAGARHYYPDCKAILDVGGQDSKAMVFNDRMKMWNYKMSGICAAGTGAFLDSVAVKLNVPVEEMADRANYDSNLEFSSVCAVLSATSINKFKNRFPMGDIIGGACRAQARTIMSGVGELFLGYKGDIVFQGGVAYNRAVAYYLKEITGNNIIIPEFHGVMGALGAACLALQFSELKGKLDPEAGLPPATRHLASVDLRAKATRRDFLGHGKEPLVELKDHHEPIIDRETWQAVQRELSRRNRVTGCGGHGNRYPLSGKIRCGECGKSFSHRTKKRQDGSSYYRWCCFTATNEGLRRTDGAGNVIGCSVGRQIRDDIAMDLLRRSVSAVTLDKKSIISSLTRVVESVLASGEDSGEQELRRLELEFEKLQARSDAILDRFLDESISKEDYQRVKARCENEMNRVQEKITAIKHRQALNTDTQTLKPDIRATITGIVSGRTADDDFYGHLLQQMIVYRDGRVEVALNLLPAKWVYVLDGLEKYRAKIGGHDASSVPMSVSRPLSSG